jgi:hypothetical protein
MVLFWVFAVLGLELMASHLLGRLYHLGHSTSPRPAQLTVARYLVLEASSMSALKVTSRDQDFPGLLIHSCTAPTPCLVLSDTLAWFICSTVLITTV